MPLTLRPIKSPGTAPAYREKYPAMAWLQEGCPSVAPTARWRPPAAATQWFWTINCMVARPDIVQSTGACGSPPDRTSYEDTSRDVGIRRQLAAENSGLCGKSVTARLAGRC